MFWRLKHSNLSWSQAEQLFMPRLVSLDLLEGLLSWLRVHPHDVVNILLGGGREGLLR